MPEVISCGVTKFILSKIRPQTSKKILLFQDIAQHIDQRGTLYITNIILILILNKLHLRNRPLFTS